MFKSKLFIGKMCKSKDLGYLKYLGSFRHPIEDRVLFKFQYLKETIFITEAFMEDFFDTEYV